MKRVGVVLGVDSSFLIGADMAMRPRTRRPPRAPSELQFVAPPLSIKVYSRESGGITTRIVFEDELPVAGPWSFPADTFKDWCIDNDVALNLIKGDIIIRLDPNNYVSLNANTIESTDDGKDLPNLRYAFDIAGEIEPIWCEPLQIWIDTRVWQPVLPYTGA
jgi:hypothetical protein